MAARILVFEADSRFAADLARRLTRLGAEVHITDDGDAGVDWAAAHKPDAIVLSLELKVNGFLVCKKLKKLGDTAPIPVIILSSDVPEETFEQHKKLRTRAEAYLRIQRSGEGSVDAVVQLLESFVPLASHQNSILSISDDDIGLSPEPATEMVSHRMTASETDAIELEFSQGKDRTQVTEGLRADANRFSSIPPKLREEATGTRRLSSSGEMSSPFLRRPSGTMPSVRPAPIPSARPTAPREFLELREAINRKEREILDLKDEVAQRDRRLIEFQERILASERSQTESRSRQLLLEREIEEIRSQGEAVQVDRDRANTEIQNLMTRLERSDQKVRRLDEEISQQKQQHARESERLIEEHRQELEGLERASQEKVAQLESEMQQARTSGEHRIEELRNKHETQVVSLGRRLSELDVALAGASNELSEAGEKIASLMRTKEALETELNTRVQQLEATETSLNASVAQVGALSIELDRLNEVGRELEARTSELERTRQVATTIESRLSATQAALSSAQSRAAELGSRVNELEDTAASLLDQLRQRDGYHQRLREALSIGLSILDLEAGQPGVGQSSTGQANAGQSEGNRG